MADCREVERGNVSSPLLAITAISVTRATSDPEHFRVQLCSPDGVLDPAGASVIYDRTELFELLGTLSNVFIRTPLGTLHRAHLSHGTHGHRYLDTKHVQGAAIVRGLPEFSFVNAAKAADVARLYAIHSRLFEHGAAMPPEALQRYVDFGWVERRSAGLELTELGRALLAYVKPAARK